jgi:hypothetical protein
MDNNSFKRQKVSDIKVVNILDYKDNDYLILILDNEKRRKQEKFDSSLISEIKETIKNTCPGCYPIFQQNQLGHVGLNGCLGDYYE